MIPKQQLPPLTQVILLPVKEQGKSLQCRELPACRTNSYLLLAFLFVTLFLYPSVYQCKAVVKCHHLEVRLCCTYL